ncbi:MULTISPECIES: pyrimidine 5'-nucleotidase [unclassified Sphingomonas]|uniref:pyrimidine 5'-nucleotidase n=1 Tax=unclassified Sphingomonas TaxID=196159 RepID=UPI000BCEA7DE|nr:MAG: pyrimidine 5'-nucleotidase [Sphingomonas sp. 32-62-10]OYY66485.1 MAG: pyrimidine 5'-nucleotidase [Sphingomonas sp. 28-62-11]
MLARLAHIRNWIFDLDNTLYPANINLFSQVDQRITDYIADRFGLDPVAARAKQKDYFHARGTTLAGLMDDHGTDPHDYLDYVHDVEMDVLEHNAPLVAAIARLPGRKLIFTNGDAPYARKVLDRIGLSESFEAIHDIHATAYVPKPEPSVYAGLCAAYDIDPHASIFFEDMARNLKPAKAIGMTTVWIDNGSEQHADQDRDFIDFTISDITGWLHEIMEDA